MTPHLAPLPTPCDLRKLLRYEPETGKLYWLERPRELFSDERRCKTWNTRYAGKEALTAYDKDGYKNGRIFNRFAIAHRVIWALVYGEWPVDQVDHINGVKGDNRIENLRGATNAENSRNLARSSRNTSGRTGVYWLKDRSKWTAAIGVDGRLKHLGVFGCFDAAVTAREDAELKYGFHPNHGRPT